jgi:hypothetical protein
MVDTKQVYLLFFRVGEVMILDNYKSKVNLHTFPHGRTEWMDELEIRQQMFRVAMKWYPSAHDLGRKWDMIDEMLEIPTIKKALAREWTLTHYHDVDEFYKD